MHAGPNTRLSSLYVSDLPCPLRLIPRSIRSLLIFSTSSLQMATKNIEGYFVVFHLLNPTIKLLYFFFQPRRLGWLIHISKKMAQHCCLPPCKVRNPCTNSLPFPLIPVPTPWMGSRWWPLLSQDLMDLDTTTVSLSQRTFMCLLRIRCSWRVCVHFLL